MDTEPSPPRYARAAFPPYRHVPGRTPHPHRDPGGHGMAGAPPPAAAWSPDGWALLEPWLYAVDLLNAGYWWEAHEVLEGLWGAAGRTDPWARFVQSLVHLAAAELNRARGREAAAARQAGRAAAGLAAAPARPLCLGIDVNALAAAVRASFAAPGGGPVAVRLTFPDAA